MAAHAILAVIAALAVVGGAGAAAVGNGMFHSGGNSTFNLGTLNPGQSGNATITDTVYLNNSSSYSIHMDKQDRIGSVFSTFRAYASVNGTTYNLSSGEDGSSNIMLSAGNHTFVITLVYSVRDNVTSVNDTAIPFVYLHASDDNGQANDSAAQNYNSSVTVPASGDNGNADNHGGQLTLAYLTFKTNGNIPNHHGDDVSDDALARLTA